MPIYEYRCAACGAELSALVRRAEEAPRSCEACGADRLERLVSAFSVRTRRSDAGALRASSRDLVERPERFGAAMHALEDKTGVRLDARRVDAAVERLAEAGKPK
ncbi:MAG: hypothetical protein DCC71_03445 [Proteobacteria bacterium]|nr:MAG: hypothetical protein DCC71_03445 [Pseudomonadota bacterium]